MNIYKVKPKTIRNRMVGQQLLIIVPSLLLCGVMFLVSMFMQLGTYIENDIDYYLQNANNNLSAKTEILENIVIVLRNNEAITKYLGSAQKTDASQEDMDKLKKDFIQDAGIYSGNNLVSNDSPFLESLFLFDNKGNSLSAHYYSLSSMQSDSLKESFTKMYHDYSQTRLENGTDYKFIFDDDYVYLCWTLYDKSMQSVGTLIFAINLNTISEIMQRSDNYSNTIWLLTGENYGILASYNSDGISESDIASMEKESGQYLINSHDLAMNMHSTIAIPKNHINKLLFSSLKYYILGFMLIVIVDALILFLWTYYLTKPLSAFTDSIKQVRNGDFSTKLPTYDIAEFQEISRSFNAMTDHITYLVHEVYEKQILIKSAELKFTQSQMNPHFMFNVLNTIALNAKINGDDEVSNMLSTFSRFVQATLFKQGEEKVQIRKELQYVEYYLNLQRYRYGDRLTFKLDVTDEALFDLYIPRLCLQLVVENSVVHGIEPKAGRGVICVTILAEDEELLIEVQDDGVGFKNAKEDREIDVPIPDEGQVNGHNMVGLNNVHSIIKITYGENYGVNIRSRRGVGSTVTIRLPFDTTGVQGGTSIEIQD